MIAFQVALSAQSMKVIRFAEPTLFEVADSSGGHTGIPLVLFQRSCEIIWGTYSASLKETVVERPFWLLFSKTIKCPSSS